MAGISVKAIPEITYIGGNPIIKNAYSQEKEYLSNLKLQAMLLIIRIRNTKLTKRINGMLNEVKKEKKA